MRQPIRLRAHLDVRQQADSNFLAGSPSPKAQRLLNLDDLRADRGIMDIVDAAEHVIGQAPAPIAVSPTTGPAYDSGGIEIRGECRDVTDHRENPEAARHAAPAGSAVARPLPGRNMLRRFLTPPGLPG